MDVAPAAHLASRIQTAVDPAHRAVVRSLGAGHRYVHAAVLMRRSAPGVARVCCVGQRAVCAVGNSIKRNRE